MTALPTIIIDTREPALEAGDDPSAIFVPRVWAPHKKDEPFQSRVRIDLPTKRAKLNVGDYSIEGLEGSVALERKTLEDLLSTLFGSGTDALGERTSNLDRFRAELERARDGAFFAIFVETSIAKLYAEAKVRHDRYGKGFDPESVLGMLDAFAVDLGVPTYWWEKRSLAEVRVGTVLTRIWEQATGRAASKKAHARSYAIPWLDALAKPATKVSPDKYGSDATPEDRT